MKKIYNTFSLLGIFLLPLSAYAATEVYTLDPSHSFISWKIDHFGFSHPTGKWFANGKIELDKEHLQNSKVNVTINIKEMVTGIEKLDKHLKSKDFFDEAQFPTSTFESKTIESTDNKTANVHGMLTVHGVSKPITLQMTMNKMGESPASHKETVGFSGQTTLKRSDFGMNSFLPGLGDEVKIDIEAEATKNK